MVRIEKVKFDYEKPAEKFFRKHEDIREAFRIDVMKIINMDHPNRSTISLCREC